MRFEFATAGRILFGPGVRAEAAALAAGWGRRALLVTGRDVGRAAPLLKALEDAGLQAEVFAVGGEPTLDLAAQALKHGRAAQAEMVIGLGGGSALDTAKGVAALLANGGEPLDYAEVIGRGHAFTKPSLPFLAMPTTAGTGTEVTRNFVLASPEHRVKVSLRGPYLLPRAALVDPELTHGLPPDVTARTGLDALAQLIEPYLSPRANPITDGLCREGIQRAAGALRRACGPVEDPAARQDMALASLFGGLALANAGLGAVHGIAGPFGGMFDAPHGALCGRLLAPSLEVNLRVARTRAPRPELVGRLTTLAAWLTGDEGAAPEAGIAWLQSLCDDLGLPRLGDYGFGPADMPDLVERAAVASSMRANPVALNEQEIAEIVERAR